LAHNGIDIDQFILLTIYPTITFFAIGVIAKRLNLNEPLKYGMQAFSCVVFAVFYFVAIPNGGAYGLAAVLIIFGGIVFLMARKYMIHVDGEEENRVRLRGDPKT
jgi:hypothetical protein